MKVLLLCVFALHLAASDENPPIIFKYVTDFTEIWNDDGSGADDDVSYWQPRDFAYDYFALGDVVTMSHDKPEVSAMMVKSSGTYQEASSNFDSISIGGGSASNNLYNVVTQASDKDALARPQRFQEIWRDKGSGADDDVKIMRMIPPLGFVCLGNVVVKGYYTTPDANKYRCVNSRYTTSGALEKVWDDDGSGADADVSNWRVVRGSNYNTQETGCFLSINRHSKPTDSPYLLHGDFAKSHLAVPDQVGKPDLKIKLYKSRDLDRIWWDKGSGADDDFACWRTRGQGETYSLGDVPTNSYRKPGSGVVAKAVEAGALLAPYDYRRVWKDSGSGADQDGSFWQPLCNGGYVAMGHVCSGSHAKPSLNDVRCVKNGLVSKGLWSKVWDDSGSGADDDAQVSKAIAKNNTQQALEAMGTMRSHNMPYFPAFVLLGDKTTVIDGKPVRKYTMTNVRYNLDDREILGGELTNLARLTVENKASTAQTSTRTLTGSWTETKSWSHVVGIELSVSMTVEGGVPLIGKASTTISASTSYSYTTGGSVSETRSDSTAATLTVPANSQLSVTMVGNNYKADVPFTADITTEYEDGTYAYRFGVSGTYNDVSVSDRRVIYGDTLEGTK